ncbi:hypothetical protein VT03_06035 [Planctomyces sp. SH-PL14]|nr:hypothetical protein VT03_06035 [Planctomyces sp. SH-PL14]
MRAIPSVSMADSGGYLEFEPLFFHPVLSLRTTHPTVVH